MCEVPLGPEKRAELLVWPVEIKASRLQHCLENDFFDDNREYSPAESLGLTLLWFAALYGRENASEGEIWPHVAQQFPAESRSVLFAQGHPRPALKWALERGCKRFGLRHAFGRHGGQAYYVTVYLQFGFTRRGLANLPQWLSGYGLPTAVRLLLQESDAFRQLWSKLQANQAAPENPFWPEGWTGQAAQAYNGAKLVWSEHGPEFEIHFAEVFPGLADGSYQLEEPFEWFQVIEGVAFPSSVTCDPEPGSRSLSLSSLCDEQTHFQELDLWDGEVQFWDQHGRTRRNPVVGGSVHVPTGWTVQSATLRTHGDWAQVADLPLTLQDDEGQTQVWTSSSNNPLQQTTLQWETGKISWLPHQLEGILHHLPEGTRVRGAEVSDYFGSWHVQCELPADLKQAGWGLRLQHQGRTRTLQGDLNLKVITWQVNGQWKTFEDQGRLDVGRLQHRPFRFLGDFADYGLLEGNRFLGRPGSTTSPIRGLSGYGAPLTLRRGPFNSQDEPDRRLMSSLTHQHLIRTVHFEDGQYQLELNSAAEPGPKHFLIFWDGLHMVRQPYALRGPLPTDKPLLVALGYGRSWLGSFWTRNRPPLKPENPRLAAHLMRWARMPLLEYTHRCLAQQWMRGQELVYAMAWMETEFDGLEHSQDEGWFEVLRALLPTDLEVSPDEARQLLRLAPWHSWLRVHPRLLEDLLSTAECTQEIAYLCRLLEEDLESKTEQEMGVDRGWLKRLLEIYFEGRSCQDLDLALAFPAFQQLVLRESLR